MELISKGSVVDGQSNCTSHVRYHHDPWPSNITHGPPKCVCSPKKEGKKHPLSAVTSAKDPRTHIVDSGIKWWWECPTILKRILDCTEIFTAPPRYTEKEVRTALRTLRTE
eukprot:jgi/Botrbrau1/1653/Bobra.0185s0063.1